VTAPLMRQLGWLDANVFIHPLFEHDPHRPRCEELLRMVYRREAEAWVHPVTVHELTYALPRVRPDTMRRRDDVLAYLGPILALDTCTCPTRTPCCSRCGAGQPTAGGSPTRCSPRRPRSGTCPCAAQTLVTSRGCATRTSNVADSGRDEPDGDRQQNRGDEQATASFATHVSPWPPLPRSAARCRSPSRRPSGKPRGSGPGTAWNSAWSETTWRSGRSGRIRGLWSGLSWSSSTSVPSTRRPEGRGEVRPEAPVGR